MIGKRQLENVDRYHCTQSRKMGPFILFQEIIGLYTTMFVATSAVPVCRRKQCICRYNTISLHSVDLRGFTKHIKYLMKIHVLWCYVIYPLQVFEMYTLGKLITQQSPAAITRTFWHMYNV